jgi:hypothetical protein
VVARVAVVVVAVGATLGCAAGCGSSAPIGGDAALRPPRLVRLSDGGPAFLAYDGEPNLDPRLRDWPVSLIFTRHATVSKVKRRLRSVGLTRIGNTHYLPYQVGAAGLRFDGDRGLKGACDGNGTDVHVRVYAPAATDRFVDPEFGSVVVGTAHLDRADGCSVPPTLFGFSEEAERRVGALLARRGWRVQANHLALRNEEPYRRDVADAAHVWRSDGRATVITVP